MKENKKLLLILCIIISILLLLTIINTCSITKINKTTETNKNKITNEEANNRRLNEYFNNISILLANNLNTTRASLGLYGSDYPIKNIFQEETTEEATQNENELNKAVQVLIDVQKNNEKSYILGSFLSNPSFKKFIKETNTYLKKQTDTSTNLLFNNITYLKLSVNSNNIVQLETKTETIETKNSPSSDIILKMKEEFERAAKASQKIKEFTKKLTTIDIKTLTSSKDVYSEYSNERLEITNIYNNTSINATIENDNYDIYLTISENNKKYYSFEDFLTDLKKEIKKMDLRKQEEITFEKIQQDFEQKIKQAQFQDYLASLSLKIELKPREDNDYLYYDLKKIDGELIGSFSILKKLGNIYLIDSDEIPVTSLKTIAPQKKQNNKTPIINDVYSNKNSLSFLLLGNHEKNTDTIIIVHIDKIKNKAFLIGIPRDLYWKGKKINSIYKNYGAEQLEKDITAITGLKITNHIVVDMYAFIDIVNIVGGIDLTLTEDLVDPSYKIRENGIWKTLNYKKGSYKLNGIEALRIARSRHGSNDFERSKRQQLILEAFYKKITEIKITNINKLYKIIQTIFEYVETDLSIKDIISIYNNYNTVELAGQFVLSFDNILYDTYSNIYMLNDKLKIDTIKNKGAWILLPKDNNWNNIKWYIRQIINEEIK